MQDRAEGEEAASRVRRPLFAAALAVAAGAAGATAGATGGVLLLALVTAMVLALPRPGFWVALMVLGFLRGLGPGLDGAPGVASYRQLDEEARWLLAPEAATWGAGGPEGKLVWDRGARARWRATAARGGRLSEEDRGLEARERQVTGAKATLARAGERVLVLPGTPPMPRAEGPVPGSWTEAGIMGSLRIEPDALLRLRPAPHTLPGWMLTLLEPTAPRRALVRAACRIEAAAKGGLQPGLLAALFFGERSGLDHDTRDLFTRTGTRHLLAISGLHVALLTACLFWPLARLIARLVSHIVGWLPGHTRPSVSARRRLELGLFALGLFIFVPLTGASPPVVRASIVITLGIFARQRGRYGRRVDALNLWGAALLTELVFNTRPLTSLSLQLSYLATLGLILGLAPLGRSLARGASTARGLLPGAEPWRPSWARAPWTPPLLALVRVVPLTLAASIAAVLATLPIAWDTFGELAPIGILLTPLAVLILAWLLTLGWPLTATIALLGERPGAPLVELAASALAPAGRALTALFTWADRLPATPMALPARPALLLWLPLAALLVAHLIKTGPLPWPLGAKRRARHWLEATALAASAALLLPLRPTPAHPELVLFDVGHGTAAALHLETGATWIFDAGTRDRVGLWRQALAPQLAAWDAGPPSVVLTHADRDHWSALPALIRRRPPALWAGHLTAELARALDPETPRLDIEAGSTVLARGTTRLSLLRGGRLPGNEGSRALLVEAPGLGRVLLTGDAEAEGLAAMLKSTELARGGPLAVLLLPHHGSESAHFAELLSTTRPEHLWISASDASQLAPELARRGLSPGTTSSAGPLTWPPPNAP